ncbi:MAG: tRNA (adenosine(37)-N6)-threonylcarbamoyltransferase complex transferase subunit TsaD [Bacteroidales bacterium]
MNITVLAIESSCDDTSAALLRDGVVLSNLMATQKEHNEFGGVVPELASRAHQRNLVRVVDSALKESGISLKEVDVIGYTRGPGLLGSLIVGSSFAKALSLALKKPLVDVNHIQGHLLSIFLKEEGESDREDPKFPFISLLVSGGHTQIIEVQSPLEYKILGGTIDDAAGEALDKCAKLLGLGYPGGPIVDRLAKDGNNRRFNFSKADVKGLDFSFSGVKTSLLYFLRERLRENPNFIEENLNDICASYQYRVVESLLEKLVVASHQRGIGEIALAGGVSANSYLRARVGEIGDREGWRVYLPPLKYTTDNAAMIAIAAYHKYMAGYRAHGNLAPFSRLSME